MPPLSTDDLELVKRQPLFASLPPATLGMILEGAKTLDLAKGDILFRREEPASGFYIVLGGWVKLYRETEDGEEAVLGVFSRGEGFAEAAAFLGRGYPVNAQAAEPARVLRIQVDRFLKQLRDTPEIAVNMLASMSRHLHRLMTDLEQLKTRSATRRMVEFLLRLCSVSEGPQVIALPYDKNLISAKLGMKPESLSRILAKLRKIGVRTEQNRVVINDVARLQRFCEGEAAEYSAVGR